MIVIGTRPEAIKLCPLVRELEKSQSIEVVVCTTGQHREMLRQVLDIFRVAPRYDLGVMKTGQTLFDITEAVLTGIRDVCLSEKPDAVLVQGDSTSAFAAALASFYLRIPVGHVEAGLRTGDIYSPYPEEFNRQSIGLAARWHFAPTETARKNLLREGKDPARVYVTGNTGIDALSTTVSESYSHPALDWAKGCRMILVTAHRRENLGAPMRAIFRGIRRVAEEFDDVRIVYPVHPNPAVRKAAAEELGGCGRILLTEPLDVLSFHNLMARSYLILTDSGGVQEEAPHLGKPVLVMRDTTERVEGVEAGSLRLVGTEEESVYEGCRALLTSPEACRKMSRTSNPYGDGRASVRIRRILEEALSETACSATVNA